MKALIFNSNDFVHMLAIAECCLLAFLLLLRRGPKAILPAAFLLMIAMTWLETLIFWGLGLRFQVFDISPYLFFAFRFAIFLAGPLLFWYVMSMTDRNFTFRRLDAAHLLPAIATPVYLYFVYYRYPVDIQRELVVERQIFGYAHFIVFMAAQKVLAVIYGGMCLLQLRRYNLILKNDYPNERADMVWLRLLVGGFMLVWIWFLVWFPVGLIIPGDLVALMGVLTNYFLLILVNVLLFYSWVHPGALGAKGEQGEAVNPEYIDKVRAVMEEGKLFLNPRLTLREFSEHAHLSQRIVSSAINRCLNQNFQEFVNRYRVEEAKQILGDPIYREQSIPDMILMTGFNSKTTFHRFFKKYAGVSPNEYRQRHMSDLRDEASQ